MPLEAIGSGGGFGPLVHKFGANLDVDVLTTPEDVWDGPAASCPFPAAAAAASIVSSSANDAAGLGGVQTVRVQGILPAPGYLPFTEDVTLDGLNPVALATQPFRVNRMFALAPSVGISNAGVIDLSVGGVVVSRIDGPPTVPDGRGQTLQAVYTVPGPYLLSVFSSWYGSLTRQLAAAAEICLHTREPAGPWRVRQLQGLHTTGSTFMQFSYLVGSSSDATVGPPGTDVRVTCTSVTTNDTQVNAGFTIELL